MCRCKNWSKYSVVLLGFFLFVHSSAFGQLRINDIFAVNTTTAHDPDFGDFSDYIELYNASANPINLNNYTITDDEKNKDKWALPAITLQPQQYLIIWADDHDKHPGDTAFNILSDNPHHYRKFARQLQVEQ